MKSIKLIFTNYLLPILVGLLCAFLIQHFFLGRLTVQGDSMSPNLHDTQKVFYLKNAKIKENSVIFFNVQGVDTFSENVNANTKYVKRVIGLPGDEIVYRNNGKVYVNHKRVAQDYITRTQQKNTLTLSNQEPHAKGVHLGSNRSFKIPKIKYFVLGDNRKISNDSRYYGFVPKEKIDGIVKVPFWNNKAKFINSYNN
ncbi:MAG TPA: signal peptidase I [Ligilactobacillus acidipiscis]|uniref:Signal peptidase I n=1 Tax=Ligilactobacillus acidipiscis TaxID=89059 RepID=A0A921FA63_9LACO|nr:signal peptidase I [Ligilactobacillus acidipiscis]